MLFGMDWMCLHRTKVDCLEKAIECLDDKGEKIILLGNKKPKSVRMVNTIQGKHSCRKGCVMFAVNISSEKGKGVRDEKILKRYHVLEHYQDMFSP